MHYLSGDKAQDVLKKFEIAASKSKKMKLFTKNGASQRSNVGTIDYSTIMQVIDSLGNINYTFKIINHPEDDENTFHNLVLKELGEEEFKILLIKYQHFDANYKFNENTTFKSINLTSTEPCNNEPIPISGGGGGGGTYDPGIPNPGSGGSGGSGTYNPSDSPSCWETLYIRCCHNTEFHYGNSSDCICPEGERGATIIYNICDITRPPTFIIGRNTNIDPCNPDGEVGVLVPLTKDDCDVLKDLLKPEKTNLLNKINQLIPKTSLPDEQGYVFKMLLDSDDNEDYLPAIPVNGNGLSIYFNLNNFTYGTIHTHPAGGINMFSFEDIETLYATYSTVTGSVRKSMVFTSIVCANGAVYTLRVGDPTQLNSLLNAFKNPPITVQETEVQKYERIEKNFLNKYKNEPDLEKAFLELTENFGIKLFKLNTSKDGWNELILNELPNPITVPQVVSNPCN